MICDWEVQTFDYWVKAMDQERSEPELPRSGVKVSACILNLKFT